MMLSSFYIFYFIQKNNTLISFFRFKISNVPHIVTNKQLRAMSFSGINYKSYKITKYFFEYKVLYYWFSLNHDKNQNRYQSLSEPICCIVINDFIVF